MKISFFSHIALIFGIALSSAVIPFDRATAADSIKGTYTFEGKARAKIPGGNNSTKKFKGKMRVGLKVIRLQIPYSRNGKVVSCKKMVRVKLSRKLQRNPARAARRAKFSNVPCGTGNWFGTLRLKWLEHPEGYALSFSLGGINDDDVNVEKITGRFKGSTGTLSTEENQPEIPEVPVPVVDDHG